MKNDHRFFDTSRLATGCLLFEGLPRADICLVNSLTCLFRPSYPEPQFNLPNSSPFSRSEILALTETKMTFANAVVQALLALDVRYVFGVSGVEGVSHWLCNEVNSLQTSEENATTGLSNDFTQRRKGGKDAKKQTDWISQPIRTCPNQAFTLRLCPLCDFA